MKLRPDDGREVMIMKYDWPQIQKQAVWVRGS